MEENHELIIENGKEILKELPLSGIRRMIAGKMEESLRKAPQATVTAKADMSALISLKKKYLDEGIELTYTDLFVKVTEFALKLNPTLNASLQNGKIVQYKSINIGVAVGTDKALFVPAIKNVQNKSLLEVSNELKGLIQKIKEQKITSDDLTGGTFTISNMGMFKVDVMTPIINVPEAAILSIGTTRKELVVENDETLKIKPMTTLSLTLDHAVIDGLHAARFLETYLLIMENPLNYFS
ncbi:MAG: dihydrolipoamide acetyltransferase family protein [Sedimentibacter sp.]|uniref:dihydrolipoamide acetyltransferase family protein n=1 Tax=Sedimentibacter sp. TaxID=1960295 RepID=UPI0031586A00